MPELPDVEVFRQYLEGTSLHQEIESIEVPDLRILENVSLERLRRALVGRSFTSTHRHGKFLFAGLDNGIFWLLLHFGMSGFLRYFKNPEERPPHGRLFVQFTNGYQLVYDCQRLLGLVSLTEDVNEFISEHDLGPDALDPELRYSAFKEAISRKRGTIKSALMDQRLVAGIGNVYSDEILFQAGIRPDTGPVDLKDDRLKELFRAMKEVLQTTVARRADPDRFPQSYIIPHRRRDGKCPRCGGNIERKKISGRTSYFCPSCQQRG